jgi:dipeptidyl aminopeptidase/acylaminoacyl peptidase
MKRIFFSFFLLTFTIAGVYAQQNSALTVSELFKIRRVGDPQLAPDGRIVAFAIGDVNRDANRTLTHIYTVSIDGTNLKQITKGEKSSSSPRWSPDGKKIAFINSGQIWTMDADGDDTKQITKISSGAGNPVWSPDGKYLAFNSDVYPECASDDCNAQKEAYAETSKVKAIVTERLLYRHWTEWRDKKRTHVFVVSSGGGGARDVTPGDFDAPPYGASTGTDYAFSPDSKEIVFLKNPDKVEAVSTNSDVFIVPLDGGTPRNITVTNKGYEASPMYTSDGKYILYRSQMTEGFESDRWRIMRFNRQTGETVELTSGYDFQVDEMVVSPDSKTVYFTAGQRGNAPIFSVPVEPNFKLKIATHVKSIYNENTSSNLNVSNDGKTLVFLSNSMLSPPEIMRVDTSGSGAMAITKTNESLMRTYNLRKPEEMDWKGAMNANIHGYLIKPANFSEKNMYPLLVLIHGGPQGAWNNNWSYRWNPQVFANAGYVVFIPNPRGSTGYGQKFVNEISADWGGKAYTDIMNGVAEVLKKNSYIDKNRIGAAGASYGGYMVDWILGHNNDPRFKFKALVSHAGVYNLESMAATTEELWFVKYEFKGMPWENPVNYNKWSPHKFAANFKTPTLVTQGEIDYRVPVDQSLQLYTALQLNNTDSKLVVFPDEGHWILKPQNSEFWYGQVLGWFEKYLNP